jgi:hypothetical protein
MTWQIIEADLQGVHIDTARRTITFDKKRYMLRLESKDLIHIYSLEGPKT